MHCLIQNNDGRNVIDDNSGKMNKLKIPRKQEDLSFKAASWGATRNEIKKENPEFHLDYASEHESPPHNN